MLWHPPIPPPLPPQQPPLLPEASASQAGMTSRCYLLYYLFAMTTGADCCVMDLSYPKTPNPVNLGTNSTYLHSYILKIYSSYVKFFEVLARFLPSSCPLLAQKLSIVICVVVQKFLIEWVYYGQLQLATNLRLFWQILFTQFVATELQPLEFLQPLPSNGSQVGRKTQLLQPTCDPLFLRWNQYVSLSVAF
jgi:hypothetical protein